MLIPDCSDPWWGSRRFLADAKGDNARGQTLRRSPVTDGRLQGKHGNGAVTPVWLKSVKVASEIVVVPMVVVAVAAGDGVITLASQAHR